MNKCGQWNNRMGSAGRRVLPRFFAISQKIFEMSELCNNSACFSVEIKDASDICVTFVVYACGKSIKKHLPPQRGKEKNR